MIDCSIEKIENDTWNLEQDKEAEARREKVLKVIQSDTPTGLVFQTKEYVRHNLPVLFEQYYWKEDMPTTEENEIISENEEFQENPINFENLICGRLFSNLTHL